MKTAPNFDEAVLGVLRDGRILLDRTRLQAIKIAVDVFLIEDDDIPMDARFHGRKYDVKVRNELRAEQRKRLYP